MKILASIEQPMRPKYIKYLDYLQKLKDYLQVCQIIYSEFKKLFLRQKA